MADKNEGPRLLVAFERATGGDRSQAIASEISLGGLFIETKTPMPVGTLLTVEISSGHTDMVTLEGRVFSTRATQEGPKAPPGMAIRFLDLPMAAVAKLTAMLERHRPPARTQIGTGAPPPPTPEDGIPALNVQIPQAGVPAFAGTALGVGPDPGAMAQVVAAKAAAPPVAAPAPQPAPKPNFKGTAIMGATDQADAMAQVAAAQAAAAAPAAAPAPKFKGTAIMGDPAAQAQAMAQVAAAQAAAVPAAAPPPEPPPAQPAVGIQKGTAFMMEAPLPPELAPTPMAPPVAAPAPAFAQPAAPYPQAAPPSPGIAPPPAWNQQPMGANPMMMAAPQRSNTVMIIIIIVVLLFILGGGLSVLFFVMR